MDCLKFKLEVVEAFSASPPTKKSILTDDEDNSVVIPLAKRSKYYNLPAIHVMAFILPIPGKKIVLEEKREEFVDDASIYTKSLCKELEICFESPRRIERKHIFGDGSKDVQLSPGVLLTMDELNLDQAPQDINKEEFHLERVCLQAFVAATDPGCEKELIRSGSLGLLKYIIESKLEEGLLNIVIMLITFLHLPSLMPVATEASLS
ncbi:uncharacterized protein TNCV_1551451 [Trichonephila clavipes]|nr:uncharacterized protein TNCV_1551451 [Trichonephila clavipes]